MELESKIICNKIQSSNYKISAKSYIPKNMKEIVIACHGFAGDKESSAILALAKEIDKEKVGVICFDLPSHGESEVNADMLSIQNCIQDINTIEEYVIKTYGDIPVSVFATSFGAYLTLINMAKNSKKYKHVILRSPAIKMAEIYKDSLLRENEEEYKKRGYTKLGFEREMLVPYKFLEELEANDLFKIYQDITIPKINIVQGDKDDIAPIDDTKEFVEKSNGNAQLYIIPGADHRMKKPGELEKAIEYSTKIILS